ncbi:MAG: nucleotide exchange factor GrpE [Candidatus Pacebacteria bacterium]|nr:nucleotide exchange factor GrpE [Candidatus Paceibacterota bacterium]
MNQNSFNLPLPGGFFLQEFVKIRILNPPMKKPHEDNDIIPEEESLKKDLDSGTDTLDDSVVAEEAMGDTIKKLREKIKKLESEKQEYLTGWQRAKADMVNARQRDEAERKDFIKYANEGLISNLISVLDSFDMAMGNKEAWEKADKNWRVGVEYIYSQLIKVLTENGLTEINPMNEKFDNAKHEAVSYEPVTDEKLDHMIVGVIQKGYSLNGKLLKVPKVKVAEFKK